MAGVGDQSGDSTTPTHGNDAPAAARLKRRRAGAAAVAIVTVVTAGYFIARWDPAGDATNDASNDASHVMKGGGNTARVSNQLPLPPIAPSRYLNTSPDVHYVGSKACIDCHKEEYQSYLKSGHSQALQDVVLKNEPPDGEVHHKLSGRSYRIYRKDGKMRHREFLKLTDGREITLADYAMRYTMGSGHNARSYILESDGFLMESPVTWFAGTRGWDMSPGYEKKANQQGFSRPTQFQCVLCHAGRIEPIGESVHSIRVHEKSIGCERCHGPGSLHVERRRAGLAIEGETDWTIVNIRKLPAKRQEDVCSQCHMTNAADVAIRGRQAAEFRPGQRMSDFTTGYRLARTGKSMTVVGHTEQMQFSRCYTESKSMSCTTCHDPHFTPPAEQKVDYYRKKCIACHQPDDCGVPVPKRTANDRRDNCVACHMPRSPTEISHFEFTHHRVGIHKTAKKTQPDAPSRKFVKLVPTADVSQLSDTDRVRGLGLAYHAYSQSIGDDAKKAGVSAAYKNRAREILEQLKRNGLRDPAVDRALAASYWRVDPEQCIKHAQDALKYKSLPNQTRQSALYLQATSYYDTKRFKSAIPIFEQLNQIERFELNWMLLSVSRYEIGDYRDALHDAKKAAEIAPDRADIQELISRIYVKLNRPQLALKHLERAKLLKEIVQPR